MIILDYCYKEGNNHYIKEPDGWRELASKFCPNCVPDYLNNLISVPPYLSVGASKGGGVKTRLPDGRLMHGILVYRGCSRTCGLGYNPYV